MAHYCHTRQIRSPLLTPASCDHDKHRGFFSEHEHKQWLTGLPRGGQGEAKQPCSPLGRLRHSPTLLMLNWPRNRR
jgi:hypothetical protein